MNKELQFIIDIVKQAEMISKESFSVEQKGGENDLVTNLDVKIEEFLISEIKRKYPDFDIVSEEGNYNKKPTDNCFIIDPIDGTVNFANNIPLWAIQVACKKNGKTVAAVIDMPRINEFYYADESGAYLNGKRISVSQVPIKNALYVVDGNNNLAALTRMSKHTTNKRSFGGVCISMAFVASGRIHGAVFRSDKPWDYEPGLFIIEMAGGKTMNISGFHAGAMNEEFLNILKLETEKKQQRPNVFVLHSLNGDTLQGWGQDVKSFLVDKDIDCFMPNFPIRAESSFEKFDEILSTYLNTGKLNNNSIVICHSIGNPYFVRFCRKHGYLPNQYIAVAPRLIYKNPLKRTDYMLDVANRAYPQKADLDYWKNYKNVTCIYSDEPEEIGKPEEFTDFIKDFNAKGIYLTGYNHFDGYHRIYRIPELLELLNNII